MDNILSQCRDSPRRNILWKKPLMGHQTQHIVVFLKGVALEMQMARDMQLTHVIVETDLIILFV